MPKRKREDFIDLYHASWHRRRPELTNKGGEYDREVDTPKLIRQAREETDRFSPSGTLGPKQATWSHHVLYTGPIDTVANLVGTHRPFVHHYRVPRSAIEDLGYGDDMEELSQLPSRSLAERGHTTTLFSALPLSNRHVVASGRVQTYLNNIEAPRANPKNYVIPITHMEDLGIQHVGTYGMHEIEEAAMEFMGRRGTRGRVEGHPRFLTPRYTREHTPSQIGLPDRDTYNLGLSVIQAQGRRRAFGRPVARKPDSSGEVSVGGKTSALTSPQFTQLSLFGENE